MKIKNVNLDIALTHIITRKRQTIVAALGVTIGIAIYLFMNSLSSGFTMYSRNEIFKNNAHIKIYKEDKTSTPLSYTTANEPLPILVNPQLLSESKKIINPNRLIEQLKEESSITHVFAQVNVDVFYNNGKTQLKGTANGVHILEADSMFDIASYMIAGDLNDLAENKNAIIIGKGIAENLNLRLNDNITVSSSFGVVKLLKIKGIFSTGNSFTDKAKSYIQQSTAQQFVKEDIAYVTTILANTKNQEASPQIAEKIQALTPYTVEPWQVTNADVLSGDLVRGTMMRAISLSILIVAAFGIYNILNMTVMQKLNDISILKATGFSGRDVITIFVTEALIMGAIGCLIGIGLGTLLILALANVYMGPPVGYFPIYFDASIFMKSFIIGMLVTFFAGFIPALKASRVDPVEIFRK